MIDADLKIIERATYRASMDSGLWDAFLASIISMLAIAPLLSVHLGDFWASAVFLPFYAVILVVIRILTVRVVRPRIGVVELARPRRQRLQALTVIMLVVNVVALIVGFVAATRTPVVGGPIVSFAMSMVILVGFSLASFVLEIPRVFFYGLMLAAAPLIGEALFIRGYASHHGFPIVFGVSAVVILLSGIVRFVRFLPKPQVADELPVAEGPDD
jgi:hypothetical protein